jgi:hypothetical protein
MTSSYHEISESETFDKEDVDTSLQAGAQRLLHKARNWVGDLSLEGVVAQEGQQVTYVAQDLTQKIITSSPKRKETNGKHFPSS